MTAIPNEDKVLARLDEDDLNLILNALQHEREHMQLLVDKWKTDPSYTNQPEHLVKHHISMWSDQRDMRQKLADKLSEACGDYAYIIGHTD